MSPRELLQAVFGRDWALSAAEAFGVAKESIYKVAAEEGSLSRRRVVILLNRVPARRREIERVRDGKVALSSRLMFDWAQQALHAQIEREAREQFERLSTAEACLREALARSGKPQGAHLQRRVAERRRED